MFLCTMCSTGARCFGRVRAHSSAVAFFVPPPVEPNAHVNLSLIGMRRRTFILICRTYIHIHMLPVFYYTMGENGFDSIYGHDCKKSNMATNEGSVLYGLIPFSFPPFI